MDKCLSSRLGFAFLACIVYHGRLKTTVKNIAAKMAFQTDAMLQVAYRLKREQILFVGVSTMGLAKGHMALPSIRTCVSNYVE